MPQKRICSIYMLYGTQNDWFELMVSIQKLALKNMQLVPSHFEHHEPYKGNKKEIEFLRGLLIKSVQKWKVLITDLIVFFIIS